MRNTLKRNPKLIDSENPEWTRQDIMAARPASEVLPLLIGTKATSELLSRGKGRPPKEVRKVNQTLRIDPDVLAAYRDPGKGWQTHINQVLRENMPRQHK